MNSLTPIAIIKRAQQISETEWETWQECLVCNENTTINDVAVWAAKRHGLGKICAGSTFQIIMSEINASQVRKLKIADAAEAYCKQMCIYGKHVPNCPIADVE